MRFDARLGFFPTQGWNLGCGRLLLLLGCDADLVPPSGALPPPVPEEVSGNPVQPVPSNMDASGVETVPGQSPAPPREDLQPPEVPQ